MTLQFHAGGTVHAPTPAAQMDCVPHEQCLTGAKARKFRVANIKASPMDVLIRVWIRTDNRSLWNHFTTLEVGDGRSCCFRTGLEWGFSHVHLKAVRNSAIPMTYSTIAWRVDVLVPGQSVHMVWIEDTQTEILSTDANSRPGMNQNLLFPIPYWRKFIDTSCLPERGENNSSAFNQWLLCI